MYVDYASHYVRLILRGYFIASTIILAIIGKECCKALVKFDLSRSSQTQLHRMTGWLSGFSFFASTWDLRYLPGGKFMGLIMLISTVLAPMADLAVGGLVQTVQVQARCQFGQGLVLNSSGPFIFDGPPWNGQPKVVANNAQLTSLANGGMQGIYWKANSDQSFAAEAQDVLAAWACTNVNDDISYGNNAIISDVILDLQGRGYLYGSSFDISLGPSLGYEHFVAWSSSANESFSPWDVRASIDISASKTDPIVMRSFQCAVNSHAADNILSSMDSLWTLQDWLQGFQGGCYDGSNTPARDDAGIFIEQYLNTMLMVQAGANNLLQSPTDSSDLTQGCLVNQTDVPLVIFALVGVFAALLLVTSTCWVALLVILAWRLRRESETDKAVLDYVPCGLTTWMLQAARESSMLKGAVGTPTETRKLKKWRYAVVEGPENGREVARLVDGKELFGDEGIRLTRNPVSL